MATKEQVTKYLERIQGAYGEQFRINADTIKFWVEQCADIPYESLEWALSKHIERSRFAPAISEILSYFGGRRFYDRGVMYPQSAGVAAVAAQYLRDGMVLVREKRGKKYFSRWMPKDECIEINGVWWLKVDAILSGVGPKEWNERLYAEFKLEGLPTIMSLVGQKEWVKRYQELRTYYAELAAAIICENPELETFGEESRAPTPDYPRESRQEEFF